MTIADTIRANALADQDLPIMEGSMTVNWNRPIVTNAGKPAQVIDGPDEDGDRRVEGDFGDGHDWFCFRGDGRLWHGGNDNYIRNATPAEILAHPDTWPEWQDGAREMQMKADVAEMVQQVVAQPEGVWVTRAAICKAADECGWGDFGHQIADALGMPSETQKVAPWKAAYEAWIVNADWDNDANSAFQAGVMWALAEALSVSQPNAVMSSVIRNRIMGGKA